MFFLHLPSTLMFSTSPETAAAKKRPSDADAAVAVAKAEPAAEAPTMTHLGWFEFYKNGSMAWGWKKWHWLKITL